MDKELRSLLVEIARGILKVLDTEEQPRAVNKRAHGVVAKLNDELNFVLQTDPAILPAPVRSVDPQRGDAVRVWAGDRYETGIVKAICRGTPRRIWVTIDKGAGKRAKKVRVESDKAVVVKTWQDAQRAKGV